MFILSFRHVLDRCMLLRCIYCMLRSKFDLLYAITDGLISLGRTICLCPANPVARLYNIHRFPCIDLPFYALSRRLVASANYHRLSLRDPLRLSLKNRLSSTLDRFMCCSPWNIAISMRASPGARSRYYTFGWSFRMMWLCTGDDRPTYAFLQA